MIADVFASISLGGIHPRDPGLIKMLGGGRTAASGARVDVKSSLGYSPVFRAVNLIGNAVAKCKPFIFERLGEDGRDKRRATEHRSWRTTVQRANRLMSAGQFRKTITVNAIMEGNGIGYVARNADASIDEYIPLLPDRTGMAVFSDRLDEDSPFPTEGRVMYWTLVAGHVHWLPPEDVVHIRNLSYNGYWGLNVNELMKETLGLGIAARDAGAKFYGQGMLSSGVLYMPPGMTDETVQETFAKGVKEQVQGLGKAHRLLVLEEGSKYEKISVDPNVAQALETRQYSVREVANLIGCQSHKLGDTERTSYASLEQSNQEHLDDDIDPWLMWWDEALEEVALTEREKEGGTHYIESNRKALLRTNLAARTAYYTAGTNGGWLSANTILRIEGDDPIGPQGDIYRWPLNMIPADQANAVIEMQQARDATPVVDDTDEDALAGSYRELAMRECNRFVNRIMAQAVAKAGDGGAAFVAFLGTIHEQCDHPDPLKEVTWALASTMHRELNRFTEPPFGAADLKANVSSNAEQIKETVLREAAERLAA